MTRTRSGSLGGVSPTDADVDQEIFTRCLLTVVQDLNMVYDQVTGANTPSSPPVVPTLKHDGTPQGGSLLALPIANVVLSQILAFNSADVAAFGSDVYLACFPVFVCAGESAFRLEIDNPDPDLLLTCEIYDTTGALVSTPAFDLRDTFNTGLCWRALPTFPSSSALFYLAVRMTLPAFLSPFVGSLRMWPTTAGAGADRGDLDAQSSDGNPQPVPAAAAGNALQFETIHDQMLVNNYATAGWILNTLNRNINALWEALTGAPIDGNSTVTNADSATTNPATSRFLAHTQAGTDIALEPQIDFPVFCEPVGAVRGNCNFVVENADPPATGLTTWFAPYPRAVSSTNCVVWRNRVYMPDFPNGGTNNLKVTLLFACSGKGTPGNWSARINAIVAGSATGYVAVTRLGTTNFYFATFSNVPFTADASELFQVEMKTSSVSFTFEEIAFLGWSIYFDA